MESNDEELLIARLQGRDEHAFAEMMVMYQARIHRLVTRLLGDAAEAEDVTSEVFFSVWKNLDSFRGESKFSTWLYRIATNQAKNRRDHLGRRDRNKRDTYEDERHDAPSPVSSRVAGPEEEMIGRQKETLVKAAFGMMDPEHQEVLLLRDIEGLSYEEIQQITGLQEGTVKSRLHRARAAFAEKLLALEEGPNASTKEKP